jgi:hypothetical protein
MSENLETLSLRTAQQGQILEQYRSSMFQSELQFKLLLKMLEEKGIFAKGEFDTRWPLYLKNDVGVLDQNGTMEGSTKVTMYEGK